MEAETGHAYVPHAVRLVQQDASPTYDVLDASSVLQDQAALLMGLSELRDLLEIPAVAELLRDDSLFGNLRDTGVDDALAAVIDHLFATHLAPELPAFVDTVRWTTRGWDRGGVATSVGAALLVDALDRAVVPNAVAEDRTGSMMLAALQFLLEREESAEGSFEPVCIVGEAHDVGDGTIDSVVTAQLAAVDSLMIGFDTFGDPQYLQAAQRAFAWLDDVLFVGTSIQTACGTEDAPACLLGPGPCITTWDLGLAVRGASRLAGAVGGEESGQILEWLDRFYDEVALSSGLLLPSVVWNLGEATGDAGSLVRFARVFSRDACGLVELDP
jgi:hypothetical protein